MLSSKKIWFVVLLVACVLTPVSSPSNNIYTARAGTTTLEEIVSLRRKNGSSFKSGELNPELLEEYEKLKNTFAQEDQVVTRENRYNHLVKALYEILRVGNFNEISNWPVDVSDAATQMFINKINSLRSLVNGSIAIDQNISEQVRLQMVDHIVYLFLVSGSGSSPLHQNLFGGDVDGSVYQEWFLSRVKSVERGTCASTSGIACGHEKKITVTQKWESLTSPILRISLLVHEAAHAGDSGVVHTQCPQEVVTYPENDLLPRLYDLDSIRETFQLLDASASQQSLDWIQDFMYGMHCDDQLNGAYVHEAVLMNNLIKFCESCSNSLKIEAKAGLDYDLSRLISFEARALLQKEIVE